MNKNTLFVYGTLLDDAKRFEIFGREFAVVPDRIVGFDMSHVKDFDGTQYPTIVPNGSRTIEGGVLHDLTPDDLALGDQYETELYLRQTVQTENGIHAWVYISYLSE